MDREGSDRSASGSAERRAAAFRKTRDAHLSEVAEDYVELIDDLIAEMSEARLTEVAGHMGVSNGTAAKIIQRLQREGLVQNRPYRSLVLTDAGAAMAERSRRRHKIVQDFLLALGVDPRVAEADAEGMEHHVSEETLAALQRFSQRRQRLDRDLAKAKPEA